MTRVSPAYQTLLDRGPTTAWLSVVADPNADPTPLLAAAPSSGPLAFAVMRRAAVPRECFDLVLSHQQEPLVLEAAAEHPDLPPEHQAQLMRSPNPHVVAAVLSRDDVTADALREAAIRPEVVIALALARVPLLADPALADVRLGVLHDDQPSVRAVFAQRHDHTPAERRRLTADPSQFVRTQLMLYTRDEPTVLALASDPSVRVASAGWQRPLSALSEAARARLQSHPNPGVRVVPFIRSTLACPAMTHPEVALALQAVALRDSDPAVRDAAAAWTPAEGPHPAATLAMPGRRLFRAVGASTPSRVVAADVSAEPAASGNTTL